MYNFCPVCGQENNNINISFKQLVKDFLNNYFSLDSKFGKSFFPFLFKPGHLTTKFSEGKRMSYANPVRLYILMSILFFAILSWQRSQETNQPQQDVIFETEENSNDSIQVTPDLSVEVDNSIFDKIDWKLLKETRYHRNLSNQDIIDSMAIENTTWFEGKIVEQVVKLYRTDRNIFQSYVAGKFPLMMFIVVPFFAWVMQGVYYRKKQLFITHLIHSLHLHTFTYFILSIFLFLALWIENQTFMGLWGFMSLLVIFIYIMKSVRKVYEFKWVSVFFRTFFLSGFYVVMLVVFLLMLFIITALIF